MNVAPNNKQILDSMIRPIRRAVSGKQFALILVTCNSFNDQDDYIKNLQQRGLEKGIALTTVELWEPIKDLRSIIWEHLHQKFPRGLAISTGNSDYRS